jgi:HlyD family secretion protein
MFAVLVSIQNPDGLLLPGMNAEVDISIARSENVLTIPVMALRTDRDIVATAGILGMAETELRAKLGAGESAPRRNGQRRNGPPNENGTDYRFGGDFWVVLDADGNHGVRKVRTAITDLDRVEIVDGLEEGETVLVLPSSHLVETQQQLQNWINRRIRGVPGIGR